MTLDHLFLDIEKVLSLTANVSFELSHQWCIKGCADDRESIKSRSLGDDYVCLGKGKKGNNMKICRVAGSQVPPDSEIESYRMFARPCLALSELDNQP